MVKEGYEFSHGKELKVYINIHIDEDLETEGLVRDVVRRIQTMRKELELGYTQKIKTSYEGEERLENAISEMGEYIQKETLSRELDRGERDGLRKEWSIEGKDLTIWVDPIEGSEDEPLNI